MKKFILSLVLVFLVSSVSFAVSNKYGIGVNCNVIEFDQNEEWGMMSQPELSLRGIFSNFALELTGSYNNLIDSKLQEAVNTDLSLSLSYLFDFQKNIALEVGIIGINTSSAEEDYWDRSSGIGLLLGAEYFANENFGIDVRLIPLLSSSGSAHDGCEWQNTIMGFGSVGAHLYL